MEDQEWKVREARESRIRMARTKVGKSAKASPTVRTAPSVKFTPRNVRGAERDTEGRLQSSTDWREEVRWI